jgi:plastocyanin
MERWRRWAGALLAAALLAGVAAPALRAEDFTLTVTIRNHRFEPAELEVPAGKRIKLVVKNADATAEEFESLDLRREKIVAGGAEITVFIGPLAPGVYEFFGDFHPDTARGHITAK